MARKRLALERGGPRRLELRWGWRLRAFQVSFDGTVWQLDRPTLATGVTLVLPDGSSLFVQSVKRRWWSIAFRDELRVERNGVPVPGSDGDPRVIGRGAASVLVFFGLLRFVFVTLWMVFSRPGSLAPNPLALEGLTLIVLGILAAFGQRLPIALGAGLLVAEILVFAASGMLNPVGLLIQVLVIVHLVHAWRRMRPRPPQPSLGSVFE